MEENSNKEFVENDMKDYNSSLNEEVEKDGVFIDPKNDTATITENGESRDVSIQEAFEYAVENSNEQDREGFKALAEEAGVSEQFEQAEEKGSISIDKEADTATITENGESREVSIQEAFEYAIETGTEEDKEGFKALAEENGMSDQFAKAEENLAEKSVEQTEEKSSMIQDFGDSLSEGIIESNLNSDSAFDRGMGEFFESLDAKQDNSSDQGQELSR